MKAYETNPDNECDKNASKMEVTIKIEVNT